MAGIDDSVLEDVTGEGDKPYDYLEIVGELTADRDIQCRKHWSPQTVDRYARRMERNDDNEVIGLKGKTFPAIRVVDTGDDLLIWDGFFRHAAAKKAGLTKFQVVVEEGSRRDAILNAAGANTPAEHGKQRSEVSTREAIRRLLDDEVWGQRSSNWIAEEIGCKPHLVDEVAETLEDEEDDYERSNEREYRRNGEIHTMNVSSQKAAKSEQPGLDDESSAAEVIELDQSENSRVKSYNLDPNLEDLAPYPEYADVVQRAERERNTGNRIIEANFWTFMGSDVAHESIDVGVTRIGQQTKLEGAHKRLSTLSNHMSDDGGAITFVHPSRLPEGLETIKKHFSVTATWSISADDLWYAMVFSGIQSSSEHRGFSDATYWRECGQLLDEVTPDIHQMTIVESGRADLTQGATKLDAQVDTFERGGTYDAVTHIYE